MSKKINLTGRNIGSNSIWLQKFQLYGKTFSIFKKYFSLFFLFNQILDKKNMFFLKELFIVNKKIQIKKNNICVFLILSKLEKNSSINLSYFLFSFWNKQLTTFFPFKIKIVILENYYFSQFFLKNLFHYLILSKNYTPKKLFNFIIQFMKQNLNNILISQLKTKITKTKLIGFKIQLKGRFDLTKNTMSKKIIIKLGKVNSTRLSTNIISYSHIFYSKLGLSNLKIFLFYQIM